ncbi:MAG: NAD(P)/FAD-dependent oxidoreductase, partial [Oscillospiraceae bacterium]|nr:NAD(P)/FAD-dependent oxidoreductase [Oscillospiraceae bacterium]
DLGEVPRNLVVVGAGAIGLEMASYFHSAGSKVTVVEMLSHIAGTADAEVSVGLMRAYEEKGVEFQCGVRVTAMGVDSVTTETGQIPADRVLLSVGRRPVIDGFGLENIGAAVSRGAVVTDRHGMTSVPDVYAVGDVNGKYMLAHVAYREAEVAVNHMLGKRDVMRYDAVPSVVYTSPEAAWAGETEESARARGIDCACVSLPMAYSGRYVAENERSGGTSGTGGIAKVVVDRKHNNVIGVHLLGPYASEIIVSACAMIEMQMRVDDVKELIFPHPTVSEMIREVIHKM